jgi:hypothetical protein
MADERLPRCVNFIVSDTPFSRLTAVSFSAFQNASSRLTLVLMTGDYNRPLEDLRFHWPRTIEVTPGELGGGPGSAAERDGASSTHLPNSVGACPRGACGRYPPTGFRSRSAESMRDRAGTLYLRAKAGCCDSTRQQRRGSRTNVGTALPFPRWRLRAAHV